MNFKTLFSAIVLLLVQLKYILRLKLNGTVHSNLNDKVPNLKWPIFRIKSKTFNFKQVKNMRPNLFYVKRLNWTTV